MPPMCEDCFGIPLSFVDTERFSFFTPYYWGGNFLLEPDNTLSLDLIANAHGNDLLKGEKVGIAIVSLSAANTLTFTFDMTDKCYAASELQIDVRTTSRRIRGIPDKYTITEHYSDMK